jgi:hypothetical protein
MHFILFGEEKEMIFYLLSLLDIATGILCLISLNFSANNIAIIFSMISLLKGLYTLAVTSNIFDIFGLVDILPPILFIISTLTGQFIVVSNIALALLVLKGISGFVKL